MPARKTTPIEFDNARLEKLSEPITITVNRRTGGQLEPIVLPIKPDESVPGKGWDHDDVRQLDQFLSEKWCGGGSFECSSVGSNGETMKWKSYFPESRYPPLHQGQPVGAAPAQPLQGAAAVQPAGPNWLGGMAVPTPPQFVPPQFAQMSPWNGSGQQSGWLSQMTPPPVTYGNQFQPNPFGAQQPPGVQQEREERLKLEAKLERKDLENQYKEQLGLVGTKLEALQQIVAKPAESSEETKLLRQQLDEMRKAQSDDKLARMIEESARQSREMIQAIQTQTQTQFQQMQQQLAAKPTGPDPTMTMVVESMKASSSAQMETSRAQTQAQMEIARLQADVQREQNKNAMGPRDMVDLMSRMSVGQEQLGQAYSRVWELMQQGLETVLTAQGPAPHPALELVGQAAQGGLEVAQRYIQMKEQSAVAAAQADAAKSAHAADAVKAQAAATKAQAEARQHPGMTIETPALEGAVEGETVDEGPETDEEVEETEEPDERDMMQAELELFGQAHGPVMELREAVLDGMDVEEAAKNILEGIERVGKVGAKVPAFGLWAQGELAQMVEVLLPDATTGYKERLIAILFQVRNHVVEQMKQEQT